MHLFYNPYLTILILNYLNSHIILYRTLGDHMKNVINYFYNLVPDNIHQGIGQYYFDISGFRYYLVKYDGNFDNLKKIYDMHINLLNSRIYVHQIILNREGQITTIIDGLPYILLKAKYYKEPVSLRDIINLTSVMMNKDNIYKAWKNLWEEKNDYLEYQLSKLSTTHPILRDSFNYYIGLGETAIQICDIIAGENFKYYLSHKRIHSTSTQFDFYNPLNLIVDLRVRDICEYFKSSFFEAKEPAVSNITKTDIENKILYYLSHNNLTAGERLMFLARMLYPTYYFDQFEAIINGLAADKQIEKIISLAGDFEDTLKKIYLFIKRYIPNLYIEWLES